eukprot:COSAG05_NODE_18236_length_311_cov_0.976415_1_plen_29_part_01
MESTAPPSASDLLDSPEEQEALNGARLIG